MDKLDKSNIQDILALTSMQEGILFHYLRDKQSEHFFEQLILRLSGKIDLTRFKKAWEFVIETNDSLRTRFCWEKVKKPIQIILKKQPLNLSYHDYTLFNHGEKKQALENIKIKDREEKFKPDRDVPFRIILCKIETGKYELIISNHHILYDGWSNGIILNEFFTAYRSLNRNDCIQEPDKSKFKEYVKWIHAQDTEEMAAFWRDFFKDYSENTPGLVLEQTPGRKTGVEHHGFKFPGELTAQVENFTREHKKSLAALLYGAWGILLKKYNRCKDIIFDTTVSGRSAKVKGIENIVGLFMNTLPFRINFTGKRFIMEILKDIEDIQRDREKYECTPAEIIQQFGPGDKKYLFDSLLVIENYPLDKILKKDTLIGVDDYSINEITRYALTIIVTPYEGIHLQLTYNRSIFDRECIRGLSRHFIEVIERMVNNPGQTTAELDRCMEHMEFPGAIVKPTSGNNPAGNPRSQTPPHHIDASPANEVEKILLDIWTGILGKTPGLDDNFFEIGGDSIALMRIYKQINQRFPGKIKVNDFFENPTIKKLERLIAGNKIAGNDHIKKINYIDF